MIGDIFVILLPVIVIAGIIFGIRAYIRYRNKNVLK